MYMIVFSVQVCVLFYSPMVIEGTPAGQIVTVTATDADDGVNGIVRYSITGTTIPPDI